MASFDEFRTALRNEGFVRSNRFTVNFGIPSGLQLSPYFSQVGMRQIMMYCCNASFPGVSLSVAPIRTFGEVRNTPYDRNFEPLTLTFYADKNMNTKFMFDEWINLVQNRNTRTFSYWDSFTIPSLTVRVDDLQDSSIYEVEFFEVYPRAVSSIEMDHNNSGIMVINVIFEYRNSMSSRLNGNEAFNSVNVDALALAPNEAFVNIQGSSIPGVGQAQLPGIATAFAPQLDSILAGSANGLTGDVLNRVQDLQAIPNFTPAAYFDSANTTKLASLVDSTKVLSNISAAATATLASPAGLNFGSADLGQISGLYNTARATLGSASSLAGAISSFSSASSVLDVASKLSNVEAALGPAGNQVRAIAAKIDSTVRTVNNVIGTVSKIGSIANRITGFF